MSVRHDRSYSRVSKVSVAAILVLVASVVAIKFASPSAKDEFRISTQQVVGMVTRPSTLIVLGVPLVSDDKEPFQITKVTLNNWHSSIEPRIIGTYLLFPGENANRSMIVEVGWHARTTRNGLIYTAQSGDRFIIHSTKNRQLRLLSTAEQKGAPELVISEQSERPNQIEVVKSITIEIRDQQGVQFVDVKAGEVVCSDSSGSYDSTGVCRRTTFSNTIEALDR